MCEKKRGGRREYKHKEKVSCGEPTSQSASLYYLLGGGLHDRVTKNSSGLWDAKKKETNVTRTRKKRVRAIDQPASEHHRQGASHGKGHDRLMGCEKYRWPRD